MKFPVTALCALLMAAVALMMVSNTKQSYSDAQERVTATQILADEIKQTLADDTAKDALLVEANGKIVEQLSTMQQAIISLRMELADEITARKSVLVTTTDEKTVADKAAEKTAMADKVKAEGDGNCTCGERFLQLESELASLKARLASLEATCNRTSYSTSAYGATSSPVVVSSGGSTGSVRSASSGGSTGSVMYSQPVYSQPVTSEVWSTVPDEVVSVPLMAGETLVPGSVRTRTTSNVRVTNGGLLGFGLLGNRRAANQPAAVVLPAAGQAVRCVDAYGNVVPCNR